LAVHATTRASILVVDDDPILIRLLARMLAPLGYVQFATNGEDALGLLRAEPPDVVLLDAEMPGMSGAALCRMLKQHAELEDIPVIFVTNNKHPDFEVSCFELGAVDYVHKPVHAPVLRARLQTHIRLKQLSDQLRRTATLDPLTEIANRRVFDEALDCEWKRAQRHSQPLSLMLVDIDHFKAFNDHYGHPAGDACLKAFANTLRKLTARATDRVARYGGEEFALLLPGTHAAGAKAVAYRLLALLEDAAIPHGHSPVAEHVTASIGISTFAPTDEALARSACASSAHDLVVAADRALYEAKQNGRCRMSHRPFEVQHSELTHGDA
jgi:diguanylate cyclase (GGDEF)-like protein